MITGMMVVTGGCEDDYNYDRGPDCSWVIGNIKCDKCYKVSGPDECFRTCPYIGPTLGGGGSVLQPHPEHVPGTGQTGQAKGTNCCCSKF